MTEHEKQRIIDEEHLKLLKIGYYVAGGSSAFFALIPLIYVAIGVFMAAAGASVPTEPGEPNPALFGLLFVFVGLGASAFMAAMAALKLYAARAIGQKRSRTLCMIAAAASCLEMPWGIVLAVFTFMVLGRDSVKRLFDGEPPALTPPSEGVYTSAFANDREVV